MSITCEDRGRVDQPDGSDRSHRLVVRDDRSGVLATGEGDAPFPSASMIKLTIAAAVLERGLDGELDVRDVDRARGDGILREWTLPLRLPVRDLVTAVTVLSDNSATNALLSIISAPPR
jgi:beta-lactamase class A